MKFLDTIKRMIFRPERARRERRVVWTMPDRYYREDLGKRWEPPRRHTGPWDVNGGNY